MLEKSTLPKACETCNELKDIARQCTAIICKQGYMVFRGQARGQWGTHFKDKMV